MHYEPITKNWCNTQCLSNTTGVFGKVLCYSFCVKLTICDPISIKNFIKTEKQLDSGSRKQAAIYA